MDGTKIPFFSNRALRIFFLQVLLMFTLSACITTSCELQAVAGGSAACQESSQ